MTRFYISTDSASQEIEATSADDAAREFLATEAAPKWVTDAESMERWLRKVGGYGFIENLDTGERIFDVPS